MLPACWNRQAVAILPRGNPRRLLCQLISARNPALLRHALRLSGLVSDASIGTQPSTHRRILILLCGVPGVKRPGLNTHTPIDGQRGGSLRLPSSIERALQEAQRQRAQESLKNFDFRCPLLAPLCLNLVRLQHPFDVV